MKVPKKSDININSNFKYWFTDYLRNSSGIILSQQGEYQASGSWILVKVEGLCVSLAENMKRFHIFGHRNAALLFWLVVHITSIILMIGVVFHTTLDYAGSPTVTAIENGNLHAQDVDFPGVAICNVNKISYKEAAAVAHEIMEYNYGGNYTLDEIIDGLKYLGHLYLFELNDDDEDEEKVIEILHKVLLSRYNEYVPGLLRRLATPCEFILQYCSWGGREQFCGDIFSTRKTADGYCCTFNYVRPSDDFESTQKKDGISYSGGIERAGAPGEKYGLTVLLRPDIGDHHYKILPLLGYKISIFSSLDYPDAPSGTLREVLVSPRDVALIDVQATSFYSVQDVAKYDVKERDCLFSDELNARFGGYYSYSDCIMYCRIMDMIELCQCIPFFYPKLTINGKKVRTCDLKDLRCLKEYRNRWWRVKPRFEVGMKLFNDSDKQGSQGVLNCSYCFPACADVSYQVSVSTSQLKSWETFVTSFGESTTIVNHSLVKIFFKGAGSVRLKQDVMFYWYELMSNYGGICGFFLGISLISIIEFFYFFTLRLYKRKDDKENGTNPQLTYVKGAAKPSLRPLYWHEMIHPNAKY